MEKNSCNVCVTGGAGWIGSTLIKKLLERGYNVHATLRNLDDQNKVALLKSFPNTEKRLQLFEADIYKPEEFERAIEGCQFVFHVANPMQQSDGYGHKDMIEATVAATKSIAVSCIKVGTVRRLIYTASVMAASPLKDDGTGYKDFMDETCWTPLHHSVPYSNKSLMRAIIGAEAKLLHYEGGIHVFELRTQPLCEDYAKSKTLAEKEILTINKDSDAGGLEVVTLACGLVGGHTLLSSTPLAVLMFISQLLDNTEIFGCLKFMEEFLGKVPIVHIQDVCEAHICCMEADSITGRYLCATSYIATAEIAKYYQRTYPKFHVKEKYLDDPKRDIGWRSTKLNEKGFKYKYNAEMILDDCIKCARKMGDLHL